MAPTSTPPSKLNHRPPITGGLVRFPISVVRSALLSEVGILYDPRGHPIIASIAFRPQSFPRNQ
eukprot:6888942-Alexandrium_andersonii.AAC.1